MAYQSWSVVFGEQPSASKWNILGTNDASFNDGTGIGNNAITTAKIIAEAVTPAKIKMTGAASATTDTNTQTITSTSYANLPTSSVSVTVTVGPTGVLLVFFGMQQSTNAAVNIFIAPALSGANTRAALDNEAQACDNSIGYLLTGRPLMITGLNAGSTTVTLQARRDSASGTQSILRTHLSAISF